MMPPFHKGRLRARLARTDADLHAAQRLRWLRFRARGALPEDGTARDADIWDAVCHHMLIEDAISGQLLCCYRVLLVSDGGQILRSYSAQFYDLRRLASFSAPMAEIGRFCLHPDAGDPHILRMAWAAMTRFVDRHGVQMLFGCASFPGTDPASHAQAFALLNQHYLAPRRWRPEPRSCAVFRLSTAPRSRQADERRAMAAMPPLLRSYLGMGGRVSDHAVVDEDLQTLHVFTGVEIRAIPAARQRLLRATADMHAPG